MILNRPNRIAITDIYTSVISGEIVNVAGSGSPLLWQHLFWFLAHPEVYVLVLPAMGIIGEIIANKRLKLSCDLAPPITVHQYSNYSTTI